MQALPEKLFTALQKLQICYAQPHFWRLLENQILFLFFAESFVP